MNSEGSALAENEKYLDSIQGHLDVLSNSLETMWMNAINSEVFKFFTDVANAVIKVVDNVGLLKTAISSFLAFRAFKSTQILGGLFVGGGEYGAMSFNRNSAYGKAASKIFKNSKYTSYNGVVGGASTAQTDAAAASQTRQGQAATTAAGQNSTYASSLNNVGTSASTAAGSVNNLGNAQAQQASSTTTSTSANTANATSETQVGTNAIYAADGVTILSSTQTTQGAAATDSTVDNTIYATSEQIVGASGTTAAGGVTQLEIATDMQGKEAMEGTVENTTLASSETAVGVAATGASFGVKMLNAALTMGISLIAGFAVQALIEGFDALITTSEEAADSAKETIDTYESAQKTLRDQKSTIDEISSSYERLSKGVNLNTNENLSLTTDSYKEYLDICNEIADMYPHLVTGFDTQGNAIISLKGNVDELIQAYNEAAQAARQAMIMGGKDIWDTFKTNYDQETFWGIDTTGIKHQRDLAEQLLQVLNTGSNEDINEFLQPILALKGSADPGSISHSDLKDMMESAGIEKFYKSIWYMAGPEDDWYEIDIDKLKQQAFKLESFINKTAVQANTETSKVKSLMDAYLGEDWDYTKLGNKSRAIVDQIVSSFDAEFINDDKFDSADDLYNHIKTNIIDPLKDQSVVDTVIDMSELQLEFAEGNITYKNYKEQLNSYLGKIQDKFDAETLNQVKIAIGIDEKALQTSVNHALELLGGDDRRGFRLSKIWSLSVEDLQIAGQIEVPEGTILSWEELLEKIKEAKIAATQDFDFANYSDAVASVTESITAYQEALENLESGTFTMSDFIELIEQFPDLAKGVDVSSKSFDGLASNLRRAINSSPKSLIKDLEEMKLRLHEAGKSTEGIDQLIDSLENMPETALDGLIGKYSTLAEKINSARVNQKKLSESMDENPNQGYETRGEAMEYMKESMRKGEIGSESNLWNVAEQYGFSYDSAKTINENADALAGFIDIREQWFETNDDDEYTFGGIEKFIKDVEDAVNEAEAAGTRLAEILKWDYDESTGAFEFDYDNANWDEIVSILSETKDLAGLTSDEFADMRLQIGQYFGIEWGDYDDALDHLDGIANGASDATTKLVKYKEAMQEYFGQDTRIDLSSRPVVSKEKMQGAGWTDFEGGYATVYSSAYSNEDQTATITVTPILPDGEVLSQAQLGEYTKDIIEGADPATYEFEVNGKTYTGNDIILAKHEGPDSVEKANEYAEALHKAQEQYQSLQDPLEIETTIASDGIEGLKEIAELQEHVKDGSRGFTIVDTDAFTSVLKEAGYTEDQIDSLIKKIQEYDGAITISKTDPLGLKTQNASINTVMSALDQLEVKYEVTRGTLSNPAQINITANDLISTLQSKGWTSEQIAAYMQTLTSAENGLGITIDGKVNMNKDEVDAAIAAANQIPEHESTSYSVTGAGVATINTIISKWRSVPSSRSTTYSIHQTTYKSTVDTGSKADGTAHAQGTAFSGGSWGAHKTETALVGELGPELLVRNGRWITVGENGAEFTQIKKGDIIFNHKQTESLLENGYVTSRGKAYASGTAYASGGGTFTQYEFNGDGSYSSSTGYNGSASKKLAQTSSNLTKTANNVKDATDEFEEVLDWVEVRLEEINEQLGLMEAKLENAASWADKNNIVDNLIGINETKISNLIAGIEKYSEYAAKLLAEVPSQYRDAAQDGAIAITEFLGEANEDTVEAIQKYRDWAQKVADLKQELEGVNTEIRELALQKIDNIYDTGDLLTTVEDSQTEKLQNAVEFDEERGLITSPEYYAAMMENSQRKMMYWTDTYNNMQKAFDEAVSSGKIARGSDAWYEYLDKLYQVQSEIDQANIELEEFQNKINDIYWDNFDELINKFDYLSEQTQSLAEVMEYSDVVTKPDDENGWDADDVDWTRTGMAALGLHAQELERAEGKVQFYAEAIKDLDEEYRKGHYSESEYNEKLNELIQSQYDAIKTAQDEKDAIVDLNKKRVDAIKDGIEKQIDAYEELIDKKKEELDAEKDLYDFQKSTMKQQKDVSDIKRKLAALSGDNSASALAKRKQLEAELAEAEAELEETYYDRSVSNKKEALDKELEDFKSEKESEIEELEKYLEDVERVVGDSFDTIKNNARDIGLTIVDTALKHGLAVSLEVVSSWGEGIDAIDEYTAKFGDATSGTTDQLNELEDKWYKVKEAIDAANNTASNYYQANTNSGQSVADINKENESYISAYKKEPASTSKPNAGTNSNTGSATQNTGTPAVGGTVTVKKTATHFGSKSGGARMAPFVPGGSYTVYQVSGDQILIGKNGAYTGWVKKTDLQGYAKGTLGVDKDQWALIDELGEELVMRADDSGKLSFMTKGSTVIPHDITENLMELGQLDPTDILNRNRPQITPSKSVINNNMEIHVDASVAELIHVDHLDGNNLDEITKIVDKAWNKNMQNLNNSIKKFVR